MLEIEKNRNATGIAILFGVIYFIQGIAEPTEGLIAQPVRSMLDGWGQTAAEIAFFSMMISLPWSLKPIFGIFTDFVPFFSYRRRSYLILTSIVCTLGLGYLYCFPPQQGEFYKLLILLVLPTFGIAFSDVVIDAYMIDKGKPLGITGMLQSVQWGSMYLATVLVGVIAGYLTQHNLHNISFLICAMFSFMSLLMVLIFVKEPRYNKDGKQKITFMSALQTLWNTAKSPVILGIGSYLFLWNFNPFSSTVIYLHMTNHMGFSEQFYGNTISILSIACIFACFVYGFFSRYVSFKWLIHLSIITGILATISYWFMYNETSAVVVTICVGFTYMIASLIQLDLAARICDSEAAGTTFALLMAICNFSLSISTGIGGSFYEDWSKTYGSKMAFDMLILVGALLTSCCWFVVPYLLKQHNNHSQNQ